MAPLALPLLLSTSLTFAWLWFFVRRDRHPEPPRLLARTFGWGMVAWAVSAAFGGSFGGVGIPLLVILLAAVVEETSMFLAAAYAGGRLPRGPQSAGPRAVGPRHLSRAAGSLQHDS